MIEASLIYCLIAARNSHLAILAVKNLVKLSQGEYVAVEKVENVYSVPSLGQQIFIYADPLQSHLVLFVIPDPVQLAGKFFTL